MKTKLVIFGISGDLSTRKLLPALDKIVQTGEYDDLEIIGISRRAFDMSALLENFKSLLSRTSLFSMDLARGEDYEKLKEHLNLKKDEQLLVYLSVPPMAVSPIVNFLGEAGLNSPNVKLLFEKPFGVDLESAQEAIVSSARYFDEAQIYRIDHYLAKEMAQNIVAFRSSNALFSHIWNKDVIEKIEVNAFEKIGIEGRAAFYEQTGALRDVMQGHLMQLLALVLMETPPHLAWESMPMCRVKALEQLQPADPRLVVRAQYEGYRQEVDNERSQTETFVSLTLFSTDPRWEGVPLILTTGKALDRKATEIRVSFKKQHEAQSNCLVFKIQPNEGIEIDLFTKKPGYERELELQKLQFTYPEDTLLPDAYEQVLVDAIRSHKSLFTRSDEVLTSWKILQHVQSTWMMDATPLKMYAQGASATTIIS